MLQLTASPWTTEASTRERWQFGALTNRKATSSNRDPSLTSLYYYQVALSLYRDKWTTIILLWWLSQWLVTHGHHLMVTIYLHVAPSSGRHTGHTGCLSKSKLIFKEFLQENLKCGQREDCGLRKDVEWDTKLTKIYFKRGISDYYGRKNAGRQAARDRLVVVNDTVVEVCFSVVIMDGVENGNDELLMEVLDGVKTEVTGKQYGLPEHEWPEAPCDECNSVLTTHFLKVALATSCDSVFV